MLKEFSYYFFFILNYYCVRITLIVESVRKKLKLKKIVKVIFFIILEYDNILYHLHEYVRKIKKKHNPKIHNSLSYI